MNTIEIFMNLLRRLDFTPREEVCEECGDGHSDNSNPLFEARDDVSGILMYTAGIGTLVIERVNSNDEAFDQVAFQPWHPYYNALKEQWDELIATHFEGMLTKFIEGSSDRMLPYEPPRDDDDNVIKLH